MLRFALLLALLAAPIGVRAERVMVGHYVAFGGMPVEEIPWDQLTHVCHGYLRVDAEGKLQPTDGLPNAALTADGRKNNTPVLMSLGWGQSPRGLAKATATAESTDALAKEVLRAIVEGSYAGLEVDWEFPLNAEAHTAHARLVLTLRKRLDQLAEEQKRAVPYLLTVTLPPSGFLGEWVDAKRIAPAVDWFRVAAFGMAGPWSKEAAHHAPLFAASEDPERETRSVASAMRYWESRGVDKNQLVIGAPLFGWAMPAAKPFAEIDAGRSANHRLMMPFASVRKLVGEGWPAQWDRESRAPWIARPATKKPRPASPLTPVTEEDADDGPLIISYEDRNSVHAKATWAREQGYRGMAFWAVHQDRMPDGRHWLLDAANKAWPAARE